MGQIVFRSSRFYDLLQDLGIDGYDILEYPDDGVDVDDDDVFIPSAELTVPIDNNLLDRYTLDDLDRIIQERFLLYATAGSFVCGTRIVYDLGLQYNNVIEVRAYMNDNSSNNRKVYQIHPSSHEDAEIILNGLLQLIARTPNTFTNCKSLYIQTQSEENMIDRPFNINNDNFRTFLNRINNNVESDIGFRGIIFNADQGAILASSAVQPNVELELCNFQFEDNGVSFAQGLANNNGPTKLDITDFSVPSASDSTLSFFSIICNALANKQNNKLKELQCDFYMNEHAFSSLGTMLESNNGLISLALLKNDIAGKTSFCQCLHKHPTLERLKAKSSYLPLGQTISDEQRVQMTEPVIELVKQNEILKEIELQLFDRHFYDEKLICNEIRPRLEINRYRPRMLQIRKESNDKIKSELLGEFLADTRLNLSLIWLVVRDNHALIIDKIQKFDNIVNNDVTTEPVCKKQK